MLEESKIGVLIPQSKQFKTIDKDFIRGLKLNMPELKIFIESIGIAANHQLIIDKIQKLHFQENIQVIVGFFGHLNMSEIYEYVNNNDIILIASDLGATLPINQKKYENVFINSYSIVDSFYLLGEYLKNNDVKSIVSSSSFYDCGYGILSALEASCQKNNINIAGHYITPFVPRENESQIMKEVIAGFNPDAVIAFYSGLYSQEHAEFLKICKPLYQYPYYISSFSYNDDLIDIIDTLYIVGSWIDNNDDCTFSKQYKENYNLAPNVFSLLGYETSLILSSSFDISFNKTMENIKTVNIEGPRGNIYFDSESNRTYFDHYIYKLVKKKRKFETHSILHNNGNFIKTITKTDITVNSGGWHNAYLCH